MKKRINITISKEILEELDKERMGLNDDFHSLLYSNMGTYTRSELISKAIINYVMEMRKLRRKLK